MIGLHLGGAEWGLEAMIRCNLARIMSKRKMRIADVARATGLSRATVTLFYKETAQKMNLEAIEKLCLLFECQVGELLELTQPKTGMSVKR